MSNNNYEIIELEESTDESSPTVEELTEELVRVRAALHDVNEESKNRRLKLRELEQQHQEATSVAEKYGKQLASTTDRLQALEGELTTTKKSAAIDAAIASHGGIPELLRGHLADRVTVTEGQAAVDGQPVSEYVASLRNDPKFGGAFYGRPASGGGSQVGKATGGTDVVARPNKPRNEMNAKEQRTWVERLGYSEYSKIPWSRAEMGYRK